MKLVLASKSPRRSEILKNAGYAQIKKFFGYVLKITSMSGMQLLIAEIVVLVAHFALIEKLS